MKVLINQCFGGFRVTKAVYDELGIPWDGYGYISNSDLNIESDNYEAYRTDARLIAAVKKVGLKASSGEFARLRIFDIPDNISWVIENYDGYESIHEVRRVWG